VKASHGIVPVFDDRNLVSVAGLVPVMALADAAGLSAAVKDNVSVDSPNAVIKISTLVAGMLAGADSIDDLDLLRAGGTHRVLGPVRAPSTMGTFLRSFTHGHVQQLGKVNRVLVAGLSARVRSLIGADDLVFVDIDDTIREVHGYQKQGSSYGYTKVKGLNAMLATISTPSSAPVILEASLRKGSTRSGKGASMMLTRALTQTKDLLTGVGQRVWVRADSAFCTHKNVAAVLKAGATFSFTIPTWPTVTAAISAIPQDAWTPIRYPNAIWEEETGEWISDAEVAEVPFTAFTSKKHSEQVPCRLIVRRVRRLQAATSGQGELFALYRHHAFITNSAMNTIEADQIHRGHAIIEQVNAELKNGPLAHLPSGKFTANAAWLTCAVIAFNIARAAAHATGMRNARMATLTAKIITIPARLATTARRLVMHLPAAWPWQHAWANLWHVATSPPRNA
jgi:hypothetical protein